MPAVASKLSRKGHNMMRYWMDQTSSFSEMQDFLDTRAKEGYRLHTFGLVQRGVLSEPDYVAIFEIEVQ